ncbi:MAG: sugar ABC transporter permease [Thermomicrobiales bacterium]|nr:sugar ABC transporter permease [Thermomicrobiales bacterium]MCO5224142.1 sugar ABC transporter permease [Thermomicrobiales bacterium]MCO5227099.1 sugar ABC transporter permease [Thermomicrobiales bacterium]
MASNDGAMIPKVSRFSAPPTKAGRDQERLGWVLILPTILVVLGIAIYPLLESIRLSFTNYRSSRPDRWEYIGFENYRKLLSDDVFHTAFKNTMVFTVSSVFFETVLGMIVALTIHSAFKGRGFVRTSMLVPWAIPTVVSSLLWSWMLNDSYGIVNKSLIAMGFDNFRQFSWVGNPNTALFSIVAVDVWKTTPFMALLLLAGLQVIPDDVYEASRVDGASKMQQFWQITLPLLRPALMVALVFRTMAAFRVFDIIFVMNSYNTSTMSVSVYAHRELMNNQRLGYGSAISVVIFICIAIMVVGYTRMIKVED